MAIKRPTIDQLQDVALSLGIHLSESQAASYNALLQGNFDAYDVIDAMPDYQPLVTYARTPGYRPFGEENKYGAWYVKTTIKGKPGGKLDGLSGAHPGVGTHAVDLDSRDRRRHLVQGAGERLDSALQGGVGDARCLALLDHVAFGVIGDGRHAEPQRRFVRLVGQRQVAEQPGGAPDPEHQDAGGHRVEGAGMAHLPGAGQPTTAGNDVVARPAGRLVDHQQTVRRAHRCGRAHIASCGACASRARNSPSVPATSPYDVKPAANRWPPPPSAVQTAPTSMAPLDRVDTR